MASNEVEVALREELRQTRLTLRLREHELSVLRQELVGTRAVAERLEQRVVDLEMRVRRDSESSDRPPSSDKSWDKEARRKARNRRKSKGSTSKGGGKKGHKGHARARLTPDEVVRYEPSSCDGCGSSLGDTRGLCCGWHQVTELCPLAPRVTEHRVYWKCCVDCGARTAARVPSAVRKLGSFGPRLRALMGMLRGVYRLSLRQTRRFLLEVFGVRVSHGALSANEHRLSEPLKSSHEEVGRWLSRGARLYADETSFWERYEARWLWVKSDGKTRYYVIQARRNAEAAQMLLGDFEGLLTTDELGSYNVHDERKRQLCLAHLRRRVRGLSLHPAMKEWAEAVGEAFDAVFRQWGRIRDGTLPWGRRRAEMRPTIAELKQLFQQGLTHAHSKVRGLCTRTLKRWAMWFRFVLIGSEPTNNEAERALRPAVLWRKATHGSRSERGSRFVERMMTVVDTLRGHGRDVFEFLHQTLARSAAGQTLPLLPLANR